MRIYSCADFDFSCSSFLILPSTTGRCWCRGRILLAGIPISEKSGSRFLVVPEVCDFLDRQFLVRDLAVCDPVHRRYILLPAVPCHLKGLVRKADVVDLETFLAPGEDEEDLLAFRVKCLVQCRENLVLLVCSSSSGGHGQCHALTFDQWSARATLASLERSESGLSNRQYAHRCFCWRLYFLHKLLIFYTRRIEFSAVDLPPEQDRTSQFVVVETAEGTLGMLTKWYDEDSVDDPYQLTYSVLRKNQWQLEKSIPLPIKRAYMLGVAGGYLLIEALYTKSSHEKPKFGYFSVDVKTLKVELFAGLGEAISLGRLYAGFPPSLCATTI